MADLGRQAVSPLIATVLLVAFSVALGAVVMSWGEEYVSEKAEFVQGVREALSSCDAVSFDVIKINNVPQVCVRNDVLELTIDNGADEEVFDFHARFVTDNGAFVDESTLNTPLKRLHATKLFLKFPATGRLQQVRLVPKVKVGNDLLFCNDQALLLENFRKCQEPLAEAGGVK